MQLVYANSSYFCNVRTFCLVVIGPQAVVGELLLGGVEQCPPAAYKGAVRQAVRGTPPDPPELTLIFLT